MIEEDNLKNKYRGSLLGLAIGDALGAPIEFKKRDTYIKIEKYRIGGKFNLSKGEYTDDTAMTLCLAQSLLDEKGMNQKDQLKKYVEWFENGYMSANSRSIGCGKNILMALFRYMNHKCSECGNSRLKRGAGNGSLMRIAPIALFYEKNEKLAMEMASKSSYTTHGLKICADACMLYTSLIIGALRGNSKEKILSMSYAKKMIKMLDNYTFDKEILEVINGSYKNKQRDEISSSGYVVDTLETSLWAFYNTNSFDEGLILAVNLGYDADTIGAVYGQLAGAYYGVENINSVYKSDLMRVDFIEDMALELFRYKI